MMDKTVAQTVSDCLCHSCGSCLYVCPRAAITMEENEGGLLTPKIDETKCNGCGLCAKVCPGDHLDKTLPSETDPFSGDVMAAYCGQAADKQVLRNGQSGGIATALLYHLLNANRIDKALVTEMPRDGSLRPVCRLTSDKKTIAEAQGSKYCPVPLNSSLPEYKVWKSTRYAVAGLPCHMHGLNNIIAIRSDLQAPICIGLICDRTLSFAAIDYLIQRTRIARREVSTLRYRDKLFGDWPGNVSVTRKDNAAVAVKTKHRMWCKNRFTPVRCYLCFDKMNVFADIVLGDAWGVKSDKEGYSVILARTARGHDIVQDALKAGVIHANLIEPEAVFRGQHIDVKRRDWTAFAAAWQRGGKRIPGFGIDARWQADIGSTCLKTYSERITIAANLANVTPRRDLVRNARNKYLLWRIKEKALRIARFK